MSDVAKATGNIYAYPHTKEEIVWIESGKWVVGKLANPQNYRYKEGTLLESSKPLRF
ncbi:MAG: hypothetical protein PWQ96_2120 [Clostridia bacterium]|nr:hypothetical protein [Clostridiales bacterium]MDK2986476.1 hypothetical protein [Clostridia bacterium]